MGNNFCSNCGAPILDKSSRFCANCGAPLTPQGAAPEPARSQNGTPQPAPAASSAAAADIVNALLNHFYKKYSFNGCNVYLWNADRKSNKRILSAINHYANIDTHAGELPIACFDDTALGDASDGAFLSSAGVYVHNMDEELHFLPYQSITEVKYKSGLLTKKIFLSRGICIEFTAVLEVNVRAFAEMILECKQYLAR